MFNNSFKKLDDLLNYNQLAATLSLDHIHTCYDTIVNNYKVYPTRDQAAEIKDAKIYHGIPTFNWNYLKSTVINMTY